MTQLVSGLSQIASYYDAVLCDVWGVIHDGKKGFQGAVKALQEFRKHGPVVLITNAPVRNERVTRLFPGLSVPDDCYDAVVSSGDATRNELKRVAPGPVYRIEYVEDRGLYDGLDLQFTDDPEVAKVINCTSLREFPEGTPEPYREELKRLAAHGLPMICANPDVQFKYGNRLIWSAGSLAKIYEEVGGKVIRPGKPDGPIYRLAMERVMAIAGKAVAPDKVLCIGDGPATDVVGARRQGMDALFIGGGIHGHAISAGEDFLMEARKVLQADKAFAKWAMPELEW
jgi:HAD superfamily hydrolase (TIGR01459 family)